MNWQPANYYAFRVIPSDSGLATVRAKVFCYRRWTPSCPGSLKLCAPKSRTAAYKMLCAAVFVFFGGNNRPVQLYRIELSFVLAGTNMESELDQ